MTTDVSTSTTARAPARSDPAYQAFLLLRTVFTLAPILFGLDKFTNILVETFPGFFDIALRDFGLLVGAVALARLATRYAPGRRRSSTA